MSDENIARMDTPGLYFDMPGLRFDSPSPLTQPTQPKKKRMKRQSYYPSRFSDQIPWLENFRTKIGGYTATLSLDTAKVTAAVGAARYVIYVLSQWLPAVRAVGPAATATIDILLNGEGSSAIVLPTFTAPALPTGVVAVAPGALKLIFDLVEDVTDADAYTDTIGNDLGIIGAEEVNTHTAPDLKANIEQGPDCQCGELVFKKFRHMGVYIEGRRNGGAWEFLGIDTESPYSDERPLLDPTKAEIREYRARFWDKGTPNGDWSAVVKINVGP